MERRERARCVVKWLIYNQCFKTQQDIAREMGYNPTVLSAAMTGKIPFSDKMSRNLCLVNKKLSVRWLLNGTGEMLLGEKKTALGIEPSIEDMSEGESPTLQGNAQKKKKLVPYYSELAVSAGQVEQFGYDDTHENMEFFGAAPEAVFPVSGHSMEPMICDGDYVGVVNLDPFEKINSDSIYMVITRENERMIKRIAPVSEHSDTITLISENPKYRPFEVEKQNVLKVMKVVVSGRRYD